MNKLVVPVAASLLASAAFAIDFEAPTYSGSSSGTVLTNQDGWYIPATGGVDFNCYTYSGNALGLGANPTGGDQFIGGISAGATPARAQRDQDWSSAPVWKVSYDINSVYLGTLPTAQNLSSWSLQDSTTTKSFIALNTWVDVATATNWNMQYNVFDAGGLALNNQSAGSAMENLEVNHWYRQSTTFSFVDNSISEVSITDLETGITTTYNPTGWYLQGGSGSALPLPTAARFFSGGAAGNATGFDNYTMEAVPEPATIFALGLGLAFLASRKRRG